MKIIAGRPRRLGDYDNAFGFLRLLFSSLVIVAHTPELVDGDAHRELIVRMGGSTTFGGLAVSGFFMISGFLITGSFLNSSSKSSYLLKRVARIYPAFIVMFLACLFIVRPLAGGSADPGLPLGQLHQLLLVLFLRPPDPAGAFASLPYPALNGAAWTIVHEFECYLLVLALGSLGLLSRVWLLALGAAACLLFYAIASESFVWHLSRLPLAYLWLYAPREAFRVVGFFLAGATFYQLRSRIPLRRKWVALSVVGLLASLFINPLVNLGLATFGSYLVFAAAQGAAGTLISKINDRTDVSYGLYLYAWPVEQMLLLSIGGSSLLVLGGATWVIALVLGWISWIAVERPVMLWVRASLRTKAAENEQVPVTRVRAF